MRNRLGYPFVLVCLFLCAAIESARADAHSTLLGGVVDVRFDGAKGNGTADETAAIRKAINAAHAGGVVAFAVGTYRVTDEILISKPLSLIGTGLGSQIFQATNGKSLFVFQGVQGVSVSALYLGSASNVAGTSLIRLDNTHRSRFENITMLGGYYGIHLRGSLVNTFEDLRSGANIGGFFA